MTGFDDRLLNRLAQLSPEKKGLLITHLGGSISHREPIAIIGIGCRFPGSVNSPSTYWDLLTRGVDAISEAPPSRFPSDDPMRWGGFIDNVENFDADFFGISSGEAPFIDPQQRLLLEVAWEALEDAGQVVDALSGSPVGVFAGVSSFDYGRLQLAHADRIGAYTPTGSTLSIAANRISYAFNFRGPSLVVDTACSSSLVAVHLACQSLWSGESTLALAGGVSVLLGRALNIGFSKLGAISPAGRAGRCRTFDAGANGYVRGEGAGMMVLKPLSRALADGDAVYAVIRGSAVNSDGTSNGLTGPNGLAQQALIRRALAASMLDGCDISYVEAHGTGTPLGDSIEARALGAVLSPGRGRPCVVGSVKTNVGHLDAAAGMSGLVKAALLLHHRTLVPSLHFERPNPQIAFGELGLRVGTAVEPWGDAPRNAGVSAFGFGGTNAHVILSAAADRVPQRSAAGGPAVLLVSAASTAALVKRLETYADSFASSSWSLQDLAFTLNTRRKHFDCRAAIVAWSIADAATGARGAAHAIAAGSTRVVASRDGETQLTAAGQRYVNGDSVGSDRVGELLGNGALPPYPWQRQRYWLDFINEEEPCFK